MNHVLRPMKAALLALGGALVLAACTSGASSPDASAQLIDPNPQIPVGTEPVAGGGNPGGGNLGGDGDLTVPRPGQLDVHPVPADSLEAAVNDRRVTIRISWTSGIEPCSVLDSIVVDRSDTTFALTVREGHGPGDNVCIDIAKFKFTLVDLGDLEPGTYTVRDATGGADPIEVVVA